MCSGQLHTSAKADNVIGEATFRINNVVGASTLRDLAGSAREINNVVGASAVRDT